MELISRNQKGSCRLLCFQCGLKTWKQPTATTSSSTPLHQVAVVQKEGAIVEIDHLKKKIAGVLNQSDMFSTASPTLKVPLPPPKQGHLREHKDFSLTKLKLVETPHMDQEFLQRFLVPGESSVQLLAESELTRWMPLSVRLYSKTEDKPRRQLKSRPDTGGNRWPGSVPMLIPFDYNNDKEWFSGCSCPFHSSTQQDSLCFQSLC